MTDFNFESGSEIHWEPVTRYPYAKFGTVKRRQYQRDGVTVTEVTEEWLEEGATPPRNWDNKHWMTCVHREKGFELIREAEQVSVFEDPSHNHIHVSVRVDDWFQCRVIPSALWHRLSTLDVLELVSNEMNDLKQLMHRPQ
jgi:hypothetical protein